MSPDSDGVALVPLLEWTPEPVSRRVSDEVSYLSMWVSSRSSRTGSPSHQDRKLMLPGLRVATTVPCGLRTPSACEDQDSAPTLPAQTSSQTPRPLSPLAAVDQRIAPVLASAIQDAGFEESSSTLNSS